MSHLNQIKCSHVRNKQSFPGAIHTYKGRKHARVNRSRALQARRSSRHKAYHRQPFAGNPYQGDTSVEMQE